MEAAAAQLDVMLSPELRDMEGLSEWVESNGGPLLLLPEAALQSWAGIDGPTPGETDYSRACAVRDVAVIPVGLRQGLVLADEPLPTRVYRSAASHVLVRWRYASNDLAVDQVLTSPLPSLAWQAVGDLSSFGESLVLFDSGFPGDDIIGATAQLFLAPGAYLVETTEYAPTSEIALQLIKIRPRAA